MKLDRLELQCSNGGTVCRVRFAGGAMDHALASQLAHAAETLCEDRALRVVVLQASGGDFCSGPGQDLDRLAIASDPPSQWARLRQPVVVAIGGACHSVGLELALAGDIRLAAPDARFAMPDAAAGCLPCWGGTQRLARAVRPAEAGAMLLLGSEIDARRALDLGLVHRIEGDLDGALDALVAQLLQRGPQAQELAKEAVHRGAELPLRDGLRLEGDLNHQLAVTADRAEGLAAFFAKRPPDFCGR